MENITLKGCTCMKHAEDVSEKYLGKRKTKNEVDG